MSNTFKPSIPQPSDPQDVSQGDLLANNQSLQYVYGIDHWPLFPSSANDGFHEQVTLPTFPNSIGALPAQPSAITPSLRLFSQIVASVPTLFGISSASATPFPIGAISVNANPGALQLGNIIINFGSITVNAGGGTGTGTVTYAQAFGSVPYSIVVTPMSGGGVAADNFWVSSSTAAGCVINQQGVNNIAPRIFSYVAIGSV
jgi:hypothetical protein